MSENDTTVVVQSDVYIKTHNNRRLFNNELYFYQNYPKYTPRLVAYNINDRTLVIEAAEKLLDNPQVEYKLRLRELLHELHLEGVHHRDVALVNVVLVEGEVKLIDWEAAIEHHSEFSWDLHGAKASGLPNPWPQYGEDGVWWGGPWDICPGRFKEWT